MRHRLTYQEPVETKDATGARRATPTTIGTYWGELRSITARERVVNDQLRAETTHTIRFKPLPVTIRPKGRFVHRVRNVDHAYEVIGVVDVGNRGREYEVEVKGVTS